MTILEDRPRHAADTTAVHTRLPGRPRHAARAQHAAPGSTPHYVSPVLVALAALVGGLVVVLVIMLMVG